VLGPAGAPARERAGLDAAPLGARAVRSLRSRRSSPPLVARLGESPAAESRRPTPEARSGLEGGGQPTSFQPRTEEPRLRARLAGPAGTTAPQAPVTRPAATGRSLVAARPAGRPLAPGEVQVWDLPTGDGGGAGAWLVSGPGAARLTFLDRAGLPLADEEVAPAGGGEQAVTPPPGAARLAVAAVGRLADDAPPPVAGWQAGSLLTQVARATLLAPGASVHLPAPLVTRREGLRTSQALVRAAAAVAGAATVETRLPGTVDVVVVVVDAPAADPGALPAVSIEGAALGAPVVVAGGHRVYLAYAVPPDADRAAVVVRVDAGPGWRHAGVLGGAGTVDDWLPALTGAGSGVAVTPRPPAEPVAVRYAGEAA
jgi:hypothetical protein